MLNPGIATIALFPHPRESTGDQHRYAGGGQTNFLIHDPALDLRGTGGILSDLEDGG